MQFFSLFTETKMFWIKEKNNRNRIKKPRKWRNTKCNKVLKKKTKNLI